MIEMVPFWSLCLQLLPLLPETVTRMIILKCFLTSLEPSVSLAYWQDLPKCGPSLPL